MKAELLVSAEIVLRSPCCNENEIAESVAGRLRTLGIRIVDVGKASISVQAKKTDFERVFSCKLIPKEKNKSGARSYGRIGGSEFLPETKPVVPADLREHVSSIEVQEPPAMY